MADGGDGGGADGGGADGDDASVQAEVTIMPPRKPRKPLNPRKRKLPEDGPFTSSVKWLKSFVFTPVEDGPWPIVEPMD